MKKNKVMKERTVTEILGMQGAMVSHSKSSYLEQNPDHLTIFNANVCIKEGFINKSQKIWYGDLDVTKSKEKLQELAKLLNTSIYVLYEMDARFENESRPLIGKYAVKIHPSGKISISSEHSRFINL